MATFKLDGLIILVDLDNVGVIYPRIFLNEEEALECAKVIGGKWKLHNAFINEK